MIYLNDSAPIRIFVSGNIPLSSTIRFHQWNLLLHLQPSEPKSTSNYHPIYSLSIMFIQHHFLYPLWHEKHDVWLICCALRALKQPILSQFPHSWWCIPSNHHCDNKMRKRKYCMIYSEWTCCYGNKEGIIEDVMRLRIIISRNAFILSHSPSNALWELSISMK